MVGPLKGISLLAEVGYYGKWDVFSSVTVEVVAVTGFMIFTTLNGPIYLRPNFLQGVFKLRYLVDRYTL